MKIIFQKIHLEKGGHLLISVVLYSGQYGMFSIIKNNHFIRVINSGIKQHLVVAQTSLTCSTNDMQFVIQFVFDSLKRTISHILIYKSNQFRNQTRLVTLSVFDSLKNNHFLRVICICLRIKLNHSHCTFLIP